MVWFMLNSISSSLLSSSLSLFCSFLIFVVLFVVALHRYVNCVFLTVIHFFFHGSYTFLSHFSSLLQPHRFFGIILFVHEMHMQKVAEGPQKKKTCKKSNATNKEVEDRRKISQSEREVYIRVHVDSIPRPNKLMVKFLDLVSRTKAPAVFEPQPTLWSSLSILVAIAKYQVTITSY